MRTILSAQKQVLSLLRQAKQKLHKMLEKKPGSPCLS